MAPEAVPAVEWLPLESPSGRVKDRMKVQVRYSTPRIQPVPLTCISIPHRVKTWSRSIIKRSNRTRGTDNTREKLSTTTNRHAHIHTTLVLGRSLLGFRRVNFAHSLQCNNSRYHPHRPCIHRAANVHLFDLNIVGGNKVRARYVGHVRADAV